MSSIADKLKQTLDKMEGKYNNEPEQNISPDKNYMTTNIRFSNIPQIKSKLKSKQQFYEITQKAVEKINKTPCWHDYSSVAQREMLGKYFDTKLKKAQYSVIKYCVEDKLTFIDDVLKSINK